MPECLVEEMEVWRIVLDKVATLTEIDETWSIVDVMKANCILSAKQAMEKSMLDKIDKNK